MRLPLVSPNPPRLSLLGDELAGIEASGWFSNAGPTVRRFEAAARDRLFGGTGGCVAVNNATIGLMVALREAVGNGRGGLALMPAFTFAATAHAALWTGLTPLLCDSDPETWAMAPAEEEALLRRFGPRIAAIVPYATFGLAIDLERYDWLSRRHGVPVVVDAAASLGTADEHERGFGAASAHAIVCSMHATKTFATAEGGLLYSADEARVARWRAMINFGFEAGRSATLPGLNAKLPEVLALMALAKLAEIDAVCDHRAALAGRYAAALAGFGLQRAAPGRQAMQFMPLLLPTGLAAERDAIVADLAAAGIGAGHYFSPHLREQPYFAETCLAGPLPVADEIGARMLSLPITDAMTFADVDDICATLHAICAARTPARRAGARA